MRAVVSYSFGESWEKISDLTFPRIKRYAERLKIDFLIIKKCIEPSDYSKSSLGSLFQNYSTLLYIDSDALVTEDCEDFEHWGNQEADFIGLNECKYYPPRKQNIKNMGDNFGLNLSPKFYYNAGIFVIKKNAIGALSLPPIGCFPKEYGIQTWLNLMLHLWNIKTADMNPIYNCMSSIENQLGINRLTQAKIIHYAGQSNNIDQLYEKIKSDDEFLKNQGR